MNSTDTTFFQVDGSKPWTHTVAGREAGTVQPALITRSLPRNVESPVLPPAASRPAGVTLLGDTVPAAPVVPVAPLLAQPASSGSASAAAAAKAGVRCVNCMTIPRQMLHQKIVIVMLFDDGLARVPKRNKGHREQGGQLKSVTTALWRP
ncbi:hypothetical protein GCM10010441_12960 [Kitasatospora paracochleata]